MTSMTSSPPSDHSKSIAEAEQQAHILFPPTPPIPDDPSLYIHPTSHLDVESWRTKGYSLVNDFLPPSLIDLAAAELSSAAPKNKNDFGGVLFPHHLSPNFNDLCVHKNIINACKNLLSTPSSSSHFHPPSLRLTQADGWVKEGRPLLSPPTAYDNNDQRIHIDSHNHICVVPPKWNSPVSVALIIYLSDYVGGGTSIVTREGDSDDNYSEGKGLLTGGGRGDLPWINDKRVAETWLKNNENPALNDYSDIISLRDSLYKKERIVRYSKGTVLFYRHDVFHRGRPVDNGKVRIVINLSFINSDKAGQWWGSWQSGINYFMYDTTQYVEKMIGRMSVVQRECIGIPLPGSDYWDEWTLEGVRKRYQIFGFDITPYREEWEKGKSKKAVNKDKKDKELEEKEKEK